MKFGKTLPRLVVPEWSAYYIDYKNLKKQISALLATGKRGNDVDVIRMIQAI